MPRVYTFTSIDSLFNREPSKIMRDILDVVRNIALSDLGILIVGEEGTEKGWLATTIHEMSGRAKERIIFVDCVSHSAAAVEQLLFGCEEYEEGGVRITRGLLEEVSNGTLVIENLSALDQKVRERLSKVVEHRHYHRIGGNTGIHSNVRMISTITVSVPRQEEGAFAGREFQRGLSPIVINLPPLRKRPEDILFLIEMWIKETSVATQKKWTGITNSALQRCMAYDWPGNASELREAIQHALMNTSDKFIRTSDLPEFLRVRGRIVKKNQIEEKVRF